MMELQQILESMGSKGSQCDTKKTGETGHEECGTTAHLRKRREGYFAATANSSGNFARKL